MVDGGSGLRLAEVAGAQPGAGEVTVDVAVCGICGSDLRFLEASVMSDGTVLGHETAGVIADVGAGVSDRSVGDRVTINPFSPCGTCRECTSGMEHICEHALGTYMGGGTTPGAYAGRVTVPASTTLPLPDGMDLRHAALTEPLAVSVRGIRLAGLEPGAPVAILGAGPIGLLAGLVAQQLGTGPVVVISTNEARAQRARELGLATASAEEVAAGAQALGGEIPTAVIECAGAPPTLALAIDLVRPGGTVVAVGVVQGPVEIIPLTLLLKEVVVRGSLGYSRADFDEALGLLASGAVPADQIITLEAPLADGPAIVGELGRGGSAHIKVLLDPRR